MCFLFAFFFLVNYRGSLGYGQDNILSLPGNVGTQDVKDVQVRIKQISLTEQQMLFKKDEYQVFQVKVSVAPTGKKDFQCCFMGISLFILLISSVSISS